MDHDLLTLPITEPVAFFALMLGIILLVPMLFERLRLPGLVGLILAGMVIGPNGLHLVNRSNSVILLATIGLLYVMFIAGLEIDLAQFKKYRQRSIALGLLSFALPQAMGTAAGLALGFGWMGALLLGSVLASHTLLAYPSVSRLGLGKRLAVTTAVGGTILTDLLALLVLAIVASGVGGTLGAWFWLKLGGSLAVYIGGVLWLVPRLGQAYFKHVGPRREQEFLFVLAVMFAVAFLAKVAGIEAIVGAFLAGLTLNRFLPEHSPLMLRVQFVGNALFIPFFLLATGMLVDVRVLASDPSTWLLATAMTGIVIVGKFLSSWLAGAWQGYSADERWLMFGLTVPQAAATLAATLTGHKLGLFSMGAVNAVIMMILITCILGPAVVQRYGRRLVRANAVEPLRVDEAPERILVPFANPASAESLMDLALALRSPDQAEPVIPLMVVRPEALDTQAQVALAERHLAHAVMYAASADVPAVPKTRIGLNVASVIQQTIAETRSSILVLGWNGDRSLKAQIFGNVIDQTIASGSTLTVVARLMGPLVTVAEVVIVVPPHSARHPGFLAAARVVMRLAKRLAKPVAIWDVGPGDGEGEGLSRLRALAPDLTLGRRRWPSWEALSAGVASRIPAEVLFILVSAREGDISWQPALEKLPRAFSEAPGRSFLVVYPPELDPTDDGGAGLQPIVPRHTILRLTEGSLDAALRSLYEAGRGLHASTPPGTPMPSPLWTEPVHDAVVAGVRAPGWPEPTVVIGIHPAGVRTTLGPLPVRVFILCVTPADLPLDRQNAYIRWIARQLAEPGTLERLKVATTSSEVSSVLRMATAPLG